MGRRKKMVGAIIGNDKNEGLHSVRALTAVKHMMTHHDLKKAVLYHLVVTGSQDKAVYQALRKKLVRRIRDHGCRLEYFGAFEVAEDKGGLHMHCFLLIETAYKLPYGILNVNDGEFLHKLAVEFNLENNGRKRRIHIAKPKNTMHEGQFYARMNTPDKLANCLDWCEYPYKNRSKDAVPGRETYFASEFEANVAKRQAKRKANPSLPAAALPAAEEAAQTLTQKEIDDINVAAKQEASNSAPTSESGEALVRPGPYANATQESRVQQEASLGHESDRSKRATAYYERSEMILTAQQKYVAALYEQAVDADLDTDQIRRYLLEKGVVQTPGTVAWELEHLFGFTGYAASHPPKPEPNMAEWLRAGKGMAGSHR